jgi:hypothetical protein
MRPLDNASLTDGSCYIGTDWPYAEFWRRGAAAGIHYIDILYIGELFWFVLGVGKRKINGKWEYDLEM